MRFGEPLLIGTGLDEKARKELLNKLVQRDDAEGTVGRSSEIRGTAPDRNGPG